MKKKISYRQYAMVTGFLLAAAMFGACKTKAKAENLIGTSGIVCSEKALDSAAADTGKVSDSDSSSIRKLKWDWQIPLLKIKGDKAFNQLSGKPLLVMYFSPMCPHCQKDFPSVQVAAIELKKLGAQFALVSTGSVEKTDIEKFIKDFKVTSSVFQDKGRPFGNKYGTGFVPVLYLVAKDGSFKRYGTFKDCTMARIKMDLMQQ